MSYVGGHKLRRSAFTNHVLPHNRALLLLVVLGSTFDTLQQRLFPVSPRHFSGLCNCSYVIVQLSCSFREGVGALCM